MGRGGAMRGGGRKGRGGSVVFIGRSLQAFKSLQLVLTIKVII